MSFLNKLILLLLVATTHQATSETPNINQATFQPSNLRTPSPALAPTTVVVPSPEPTIFVPTRTPSESPSLRPTLSDRPTVDGTPLGNQYVGLTIFLAFFLFVFHGCTFSGKLVKKGEGPCCCCDAENKLFNSFIILIEAVGSAVAIAFVSRPVVGYDDMLGIESEVPLFPNFIIDSVLAYCLIVVTAIELILDVFFCVDKDDVADYRYTTLRLLYQANMTQSSTQKIRRWKFLTTGAFLIASACCVAQIVDLFFKKEDWWVIGLFLLWNVLALGVCTAMLFSINWVLGIKLKGIFKDWRLARIWAAVKVLCIEIPALARIASGLEDNPYAAAGFILQGVTDIMLAYPEKSFEKCEPCYRLLLAGLCFMLICPCCFS